MKEDIITGIDFENEESGLCRDFFRLKINGKPIGKIIIFGFIMLAIVSFPIEPFLAKITQYDVVKYNEEFEEVLKSDTPGEYDSTWHYDFETVCKDGLHEWKGIFKDKCRYCSSREKTKAVMAYIICPACDEFYKNTLFKRYTVCEICGEKLIAGDKMAVEDIHFTTLERITFVAIEMLFKIIRIGGIIAVVVIICAQVSYFEIKKKNKSKLGKS